MVEEYDIVIRGGLIIDGSGNPWFRDDVAIKNGKITKVGKIYGKGEVEIDARGLIVSPGFIDMHSHADTTILAYPDAESSVMQGVTTLVVGNCGLSVAPIKPANLDLLKKYLSPSLMGGYSYSWDWRTFGEFYSKVEAQGVAVNIAPLVGHGTIRIAIKGFDSTEPSKDEIDEMKALLRESLEEGAFGLSTGLIYPPGSYAKTSEIIELAKVVGEYGGIYASHIRNEGKYLIEAVEEAIRIGAEAGVPVQISHHKASGRSNWGKVNATLRLMREARRKGVEVNCDVYPYTAGSTRITALLPPWVLEGGIDKMLERLRDKETRVRIAREIEEDRVEGENLLKEAGWDGIYVSTCSLKEYEGMSLSEILKRKDVSHEPYNELFDWLVEVKGDASIVLFLMDEEDVRTVISDPLSMIGSDSRAISPAYGGKPHPRTYGTYPRILGRYVREEKLLSLEEAIRKMTSMPARKLRLHGRGLIREGFWADIVIFDPNTVIDKATYENPHQYPEGIKYVIVNGQVVVEQGRLTGKRPGKVLKRKSAE